MTPSFARARRRLALALVAVPLVAVALAAQGDAAADRVRTESGVDPTRVVSRASMAFDMTDLGGRTFLAGVAPKFVAGVGRWSMTFETRIGALSTGAPGAAAITGIGDFGLTVLNAFKIAGRHSWAASGKIVVPTGNRALSGQTVNLTPGLTYAYAWKPTLLFAVQPQYAVSVLETGAAPGRLSLFTVRSFAAAFRPSGWFYVLEPRLLVDFERDATDLVLSPIVGRNLGKGFNLSVLSEVPVTAGGKGRYGTVFKTGVAKVF